MSDKGSNRSRAGSTTSSNDQFEETPGTPDPGTESAAPSNQTDNNPPASDESTAISKDTKEGGVAAEATSKASGAESEAGAGGATSIVGSESAKTPSASRRPASSSISDSIKDVDINDPNAQPSFALVAALRSHITDLTSQVTSLNSKLVTSYTRIGDLEDDVHEQRSSAARSQARIKELEVDKARWEKEIEHGGWVERSNVQGEMQRLINQMMEETKSRETAVEAHASLETEIENLTASLFTEANKMVAVERFARARAEEKMRSLEESNAVMAGLLDELQEGLREKVEALEASEAELAAAREGRPAGDREVSEGGEVEQEHALGLPDEQQQEESIAFSDGKAITKMPRPSPRPGMASSRSFSNSQRALVIPPRLITSVVPYTEFVSFVTYLRQLRVQVLSRPPPDTYSSNPYAPTPSRSYGGMNQSVSTYSSSYAQQHAPPPPSPAQLLSPHIPLSTHSSQPFVKRCLEEDSEPALRLDLAPGLGLFSRRTVGTAILDGTLLIEPTYSGSVLPSNTCTLCGTGLEKWWAGGEIPVANNVTAVAKSNVNQTMRKVLGGGGWGFGSGKSTPPASTTPLAQSTEQTFNFPTPAEPGHQIHLFRINDTSTSKYAICPVYCLPRLRAVCEFWGYVRAMEKGLLLEDGFHFVGGRGVNGALGSGDASRSGSASSLTHGGRGSKSSLSVVTGSEVVPVPVDVTAGPAPPDRVVVEHPVTVVVEPISESEQNDEKKQEDTEKQEKPAEEGDAALSPGPSPIVPSSPTFSRSENPSNASSSSLNKPPVPKRSGARKSVPSASSPTTADAASAGTTSIATPPKLPPRRVASPASTITPSTSSTKLSINAGAKASEFGGTVDAMEIVGGATGWEDRCWAEVVRLKEAVFWSRMARELDSQP